jgi:hypothetical protein
LYLEITSKSVCTCYKKTPTTNQTLPRGICKSHNGNGAHALFSDKNILQVLEHSKGGIPKLIKNTNK